MLSPKEEWVIDTFRDDNNQPMREQAQKPRRQFSAEQIELSRLEAQ